jgi:hypothetical protein
MARLDELTEQERLLIPRYREQWLKIATSTSKLNYSTVQESIQNIYKILDLKIPTIHFCKSPHELVMSSQDFFRNPYFYEDGSIFATQVMVRIHEIYYGLICRVGKRESNLSLQLRILDGDFIERVLSMQLYKLVLHDIPFSFKGYEDLTYWVFPKFWYIDELCWLDFHFSVVQRTISDTYDDLTWQAFRQLIQVTSWFIPFDNDCFVCDRPTRIVFGPGEMEIIGMEFYNRERIIFTEFDDDRSSACRELDH